MEVFIEGACRVVNVEIPFTDHSGKTKAFRVSDGTTAIDLTGKGIAAINLSPVRMCVALTRLLLNENELSILDLSPLTACPLLTVLALKKNKLQSIDLSPLRDLTQIQAIDLRGNQLTALDLSPIRNHMALQKVFLAGNPLAELDISALFTCGGLREVDLGKYAKLKADRVFMGFSGGAMLQYKKQITWSDTKTLEAQAAAVAQSRTKTPSQDPRDSMRKKVIGVLKSHGRISMEKIMPYSELSIDETRKLVFELVGSGAVAGRFEPESDEFISLDAVQAAKVMRSEGPLMRQCPFCGKPLPRVLMPGEHHTCEGCGQISQA